MGGGDGGLCLSVLLLQPALWSDRPAWVSLPDAPISSEDKLIPDLWKPILTRQSQNHDKTQHSLNQRCILLPAIDQM